MKRFWVQKNISIYHNKKKQWEALNTFVLMSWNWMEKILLPRKFEIKNLKKKKVERKRNNEKL